MSDWFVYIVTCSDKSLYSGVTTDIGRRVLEHNEGNKGAKYTKARRPVTLVYSEKHNTRSKACVREAELKKLSRAEKLLLIARATSKTPKARRPQ